MNIIMSNWMIGVLYFTRVEEGASSIALTDSVVGDDEFQVTISLSDLGEIENSIEFLMLLLLIQIIILITI